MHCLIFNFVSGRQKEEYQKNGHRRSSELYIKPRSKPLDAKRGREVHTKVSQLGLSDYKITCVQNASCSLKTKEKSRRGKRAGG